MEISAFIVRVHRAFIGLKSSTKKISDWKAEGKHTHLP